MNIRKVQTTRPISRCDIKLNEETILKHFKNYKYEWLLENQLVPERLIRELAPYNEAREWFLVSKEQRLSEDFIDEFHSKLYWNQLLSNQKVTPRLIEKYSEKINWGAVSSSPLISDEVIDLYADRIHWNVLSRWGRFSEHTFDKYISNFYLDRVCENENICEKTKAKANMYVSFTEMF